MDSTHSEVMKTPNQSGRVLIIDDNLMDLELARATLQGHFDLDLADDGEAGYNMAVQQPPDCIVSDVRMPIMSGFTLLKKIRSNPRLATIPVILLTALDDLRDRIQGYDLMADLYLTKPIDTTELLSMVKSLTRLHQARGKTTGMDESPGVGITEEDQNFLTKLLAKIHESISDPDYTVDHLAKAMFMSRRKLERRLIATEGITPKEYIRQVRLEKAKELIELGIPSSLTDLAERVGYRNGTHFAQVFRKFYGKPVKLKNALD